MLEQVIRITDDMIETYSKGVEAVRVGLGYGDRKLKPHSAKTCR